MSVTPRSHVVRSGALRLHVVDHGGDGEPLVTVHGTGLVARTWDALVPYLRPHFRVLALDRRGHGDSDKPEAGYEIEDLAPDYVAIVEHFALERPPALGHSSGATSLGVAAARRPDLFRRIAMVDPIVFPRRDPGTPALAKAAELIARTAKRRAEWPSAQAMFDDLATKPTFARWRPEALWAYVEHGARVLDDGRVALKCHPELEAAMYRHASALDVFEELGRVTVPVLIVRAAETDRFPRASAGRAARAIPHATLVELDGVTHFAPMEEPARVAEVVLPFLLAR